MSIEWHALWEAVQTVMGLLGAAAFCERFIDGFFPTRKLGRLVLTFAVLSFVLTSASQLPIMAQQREAASSAPQHIELATDNCEVDQLNTSMGPIAVEICLRKGQGI